MCKYRFDQNRQQNIILKLLFSLINLGKIFHYAENISLQEFWKLGHSGFCSADQTVTKAEVPEEPFPSLWKKTQEPGSHFGLIFGVPAHYMLLGDFNWKYVMY